MILIHLKAGDIIEYKNLDEILDDSSVLEKLRQKVSNGDVAIIRNAFPEKKIVEIVDYLSGIGKGSIPNYHPIKFGEPNFHRINLNDERAYVGGCFHQFVFYSWNQDIFNFYEFFKKGFHLKNMLSGNPKDSFLNVTESDVFTCRLGFQFYPSGVGALNLHKDPVDQHQMCVPNVVMSKYGKDYHSGGVYAIGKDNKKIYYEKDANPGDVTVFNVSIPHGVEIIDPEKTADWLSFKGRWMLLLAVNKFQGVSQVEDSVDLENS